MAEKRTAEHSFQDLLADGETILKAEDIKRARLSDIETALRRNVELVARTVRSRVAEWTKTPNALYITIRFDMSKIKGASPSHEWFRKELKLLGYESMFVITGLGPTRDTMSGFAVIFLEEDAGKIYTPMEASSDGFKPLYIVPPDVIERLKMKTPETRRKYATSPILKELLSDVKKRPTVKFE